LYKTSPRSDIRQFRLWAVVPVKDFVYAKQRLAGVLSPSERRALSQAMVEDTLERLQGMDGLAGTLLVSDDPAAELLAFRYGASVLSEAGASQGLNAAVMLAAGRLAQDGASHMLVLHGDLPLVTAADLAALSAGLPEVGRPCVRLAADRRGRGTNGLLCSLPAPIAFAYGTDSLRSHRDACSRAGVPCEVIPSSGFALDIDTPADLQLLAARVGSAAAGHRTVAVLAQHALPERLCQMGIGAAPSPRDATLQAKPFA
jgi:2-phospho-L-lactate guanylyltransferase